MRRDDRVARRRGGGLWVNPDAEGEWRGGHARYDKNERGRGQRHVPSASIDLWSSKYSHDTFLQNVGIGDAYGDGCAGTAQIDRRTGQMDERTGIDCGVQQFFGDQLVTAYFPRFPDPAFHQRRRRMKRKRQRNEFVDQIQQVVATLDVDEFVSDGCGQHASISLPQQLLRQNDHRIETADGNWRGNRRRAQNPNTSHAESCLRFTDGRPDGLWEINQARATFQASHPSPGHAQFAASVTQKKQVEDEYDRGHFPIDGDERGCLIQSLRRRLHRRLLRVLYQSRRRYETSGAWLNDCPRRFSNIDAAWKR